MYRCTSCPWRGVPTFEGGRVIRRPRWIKRQGGRMVQIPGRNEGSTPSNTCPACHKPTAVPA